MRKFSMKATVVGVAIALAAVTAVFVEPAAAFGGFHGGGFHGGGFHGGGWGHHGPWGFGHRGWGWAGYRGYGGYYGGCVLKRYYDEDGEVVVSRSAIEVLRRGGNKAGNGRFNASRPAYSQASPCALSLIACVFVHRFPAIA
jgi:hypothetical protein